MAATASGCGDDTGTDTSRCFVKDTVNLLSMPQEDCLSNDRLESMKATFFMSGKRSGLCRCFGSHSVVSLDVHALDTVHCSVQTSAHVEFPQMCEENDDNCRKKRCTDRYDSSESSDSGVAALSSSSTSDITDPGSPFSTASTHSSNSESGDDKSSSYHSSYPSTPVKSSHHRGSRWTTQDKPVTTTTSCSPAVGGIDSALQDCRAGPALVADTRFAANDARASTVDDSGQRNFALGCEETAQSVAPVPTSVQTRSTIWNLNNLNNSAGKRFLNPGTVSGSDSSELPAKSMTCESVPGVRATSCDKKDASQTSKVPPVVKTVACILAVRAASCDKREASQASNVAPVVEKPGPSGLGKRHFNTSKKETSQSSKIPPVVEKAVVLCVRATSCDKKEASQTSNIVPVVEKPGPSGLGKRHFSATKKETSQTLKIPPVVEKAVVLSVRAASCDKKEASQTSKISPVVEKPGPSGLGKRHFPTSKKEASQTSKILPAVKTVACILAVRATPCDKKEASQASKISPQGTNCVSSAIQTRRASSTRQFSSVVSNVFTNTGSSFANKEACKKDSVPESKSIMACESPQRHASENEMLKLGAPTAIQTRSTAINSPPSSAAARNGIPSVNSKLPPAVPAEETTGNSTVVSDKSRGSAWTGMAGIPEASKTCETPQLTTIALSVPTFRSILAKNSVDTAHNSSLFPAKSLGSSENSPVLAPRTYHWASGTNASGTTLKVSSLKPILVTGNNLLAQRKCVLLAAPTGPSLGSVAGVPSAVSNGVPGLMPAVKGSSAASVATGGSNTVQLRILGKGATVPNLPRTEPSESCVDKRDSVEPGETGPPLWTTANDSPNRINVRKGVTTKTVLPARPASLKSLPSKRLKPDLLQTQLPQTAAAAATARSVCVTRQQTQRCTVTLQKLPAAHSHNTRKCSTADNKVKSASLQGKITEYFKTQVKPFISVKKDFATEFGCSNGTAKKTLMVDVHNGNAPNETDSYFSLISPPLPKIAKKNHNTATSKSVSPLTSPVQIFLTHKLETDVLEPKLNGNHKVHSSPVSSPHKSAQLPSPKSSERMNGFATSAALTPLFLAPANRKPLKKGPLSPKQNGSVVKCLNITQTAKLSSSSSCASASSDGNASKVLPWPMETCTSTVLETIVERSMSETLSMGGSESSVSLFDGASSSSSTVPAAPQTIRFPAIQRKSLRSHLEEEKLTCRWAQCSQAFDTTTVLMEHLQTKHVLPQANCERYVCLWVGCKVYSRPSCSQSWLDRHVLSHGGNKLFRCIVDGCGLRFGSNTTLEKHVNGHFDQEAGGSNGQGPRRSLDGATGKMLRRNGKKLRYRKQPWSARMFDYFDSGTMEILQQRLRDMTEARTNGMEGVPGNAVALRSKVMARRVSPQGVVQFLLRWSPADVLDDEWVEESKVISTCTVPISRLSPAASEQLHAPLCITSTADQRRKHRRKPVKEPTT